MLFTRVKKYIKISIIQFFNQYSKQAAEALKVTQKSLLVGRNQIAFGGQLS
jgi:hypothetical protein